MRIALMAALSSAILALPSTCSACSCVMDSEKKDLMARLQEALSGADAVFVARVLSIADRRTQLSPDYDGDIYLTKLEVLEQFKGKLSSTIEMPSGTNGGDCTYSFETGATYLVYVRKVDGLLHTSHCSRSRRLESLDDSEVAWLRSKKAIPVPIAFQRKNVSCNPCWANKLAESMAGTAAQECGGVLGFKEAEASEALAKHQPFWVASAYYREDPGLSEAFGVSKDLRAFQLVQSPYAKAQGLCHQRVVRRWCKSLQPATRDRALPQFTCVEPGPEEEICTEEKSRKESLGARESLDAIRRYDWRDPDHARHDLLEKVTPLAPGSPVSPYLLCTPRFSIFGSFMDRTEYECRIAEDAQKPEAK